MAADRGPGPTGDPSCTFCRIVAGDLPAHVVLDDDVAVAFLDTRPLFPGHVLVVPRTHVVALPDLPVDQVGPFFGRVQRIAAALPDALGAQGTFVAANNVVSQSVPHLHFHVVPRSRGDKLFAYNLAWKRVRYGSEAEMEEVASRIRAALGQAV